MVTVKRVTAALYLMPALVLVDWVNALVSRVFGMTLPVSAGMVTRGGVFLVAFGIVLLNARRELSGAFGAAVMIGFGVFSGFALGMLTGGGLGELTELFKVLYGPVLISTFVVLYRRYGVAWSTVLAVETVMGAVAGVSIIAFQAMGIGLQTYGDYATASKGLFIAQNDIGLAMSLTLFCGIELLLTQKRVAWGITSACTVAGMLMVGTRTGTLAAFAVPMCVMWIHRREMRSRRRLPVMITLAVLMFGALGIAGVQQYETITSEGYQVAKYESLVSGQVPRAVLLAGAVSYVVRRAPYRDVIGDGVVTYTLNVAHALGLGKTHRIVEIDWMDLFGEYGLIGMIVVYSYYLWFYRRVFRVRRIVGNDVSWVGFGMLSFFLIHASLAGHAMSTPLPAGAMAPVLAFIWLVNQEGRPGDASAPQPDAAAEVLDHVAV